MVIQEGGFTDLTGCCLSLKTSHCHKALNASKSVPSSYRTLQTYHDPCGKYEIKFIQISNIIIAWCSRMLLVQGDEAELKLRKEFGEGEGSLREELRPDIDQKDDDHDDEGDHILMIIMMRVMLMMIRKGSKCSGMTVNQAAL